VSRRTGHIYAYTTPAYRRTRWRHGRWGWGLLKVGYTTRDPHTRIREQIGASSPEKEPYKLLYAARSRTAKGRAFTDKEVHRELRRMGVHNIHNEWFEARPRDVHKAIKKIGGKRSSIKKRKSRRKSDRGFPKVATLILALIFIGFAIDPGGAVSVTKNISEILIELYVKLT
jgi:hypothetical protein